MSEKVERRTENGGGAGTGAAGAGGADGVGVPGDNNCHEVGAFSVPLISKVRRVDITIVRRSRGREKGGIFGI